ncbi:HGGxSTG domain-containing protein [Nitratireductor sp.]|uniref:HGGxSTG domain-containing protein n=1 Tax=Nitratireductor sp. TaxID=1872084 RepID=UPI002629190F|nr:HGGxSTG domain-containing protein [Nitratireductor sp.]
MSKDETHSNSVDWRFGPGWPGKRCGARTRRGTPCQKPVLSGKKRCQLHGGRAGAPCGEKNGNFKSGQYTKEALKAHKDAMARLRALVHLGRQVGMFD